MLGRPISVVSSIFKRFSEVDDEYLNADLHIHSSWTDGRNSIKEIIQWSERQHLKKIAFTDHVRTTSDYCSRYCNQIREIAHQTDIEVLIGFETRIDSFAGELSIPQGARESADFVIASVHRFPIGGKLFCPIDFHRDACQAIEYELSIQAIMREGMEVLGHPGGMSLTHYDDFPDSAFEDIIKECAYHNVAFELNSRYHSNIIGRLISLLKKHDPLISLGSDAHKLEDVGACHKKIQGSILR